MVDANEIIEKHIEQIEALPFWSTAIEATPLEGGITNHNYLVVCDNKEFVVRLGSDIPEHQILRFNEVAAGRAASAAGLSPSIRYSGDGVLVMDYIPSRTLTAKDVSNKVTLEQIIVLVKDCHQQLPKYLRGASVVFWVFHILRDYAATLQEANSPYLERLPVLLTVAQDLELAAGPFDIVFGHNDLLPANILDDSNRLWLIDWEYGGFNTPLFDLGGLASNSELNEPLEHWMLERYFEAPVGDELWYRYQAMKCASLMRETLWSMVSEIHSTVQFDYSGYTVENLARLKRSLDDFNSL